MMHVHLSLRALPERLNELLAALDAIDLAAAADDSYLLELEVEASRDDPDGVVIVSGWSSARHYQRWEHDPGWCSVLQQVEPLLAAKPEVHVYRLAGSTR
jgi:quinol monooxygenase YgiN